MNATSVSVTIDAFWHLLRGTERYRIASGVFFAWVAVMIYAASNSIVTLLVGIGESMPVAEGRNAITYTNLLLLGMIISILPLSVMFRRDLTQDNALALSRRDWTLMTISAFLSSALTPGLFFYALANTTVTNVVLITRIEPPLFLLATLLLLHERFRARAMVASIMALMGAIVIIGWSEGGGVAGFGKGEWAAVAATLSYVVSTIVTRAGLKDVPLGLFTVYRTVLGVVVYFVAISAIFGPETFRDILSPVLWSWIWIYTGLVIVLGQVAWAMALKLARSTDLALATSFSPLAGILIAMVLLGENPGPGLLPGAAIILISIYVGRSAIVSDENRKSPTIRRPAARSTIGACPVLLSPSADRAIERPVTRQPLFQLRLR